MIDTTIPKNTVEKIKTQFPNIKNMISIGYDGELISLTVTFYAITNLVEMRKLVEVIESEYGSPQMSISNNYMSANFVFDH